MHKRYRIVSTPRFITFIVLCVLLIIYVTLSVSGAYNAEGMTEKTYTSVLVERGDTLWEIAAAHCSENTDVRDMIYSICEINGLSAGEIMAGDTILVPDSL